MNWWLVAQHRMDASAGEGAAFTIELPVGAPHGPTAAAVGEPERPVVDDEPAVAAVLAEALTTEEHVVETAENGAVALEKPGGALVRPGHLRQRDAGAQRPRPLPRGGAARPPLAEKFIFVVGDTSTRVPRSSSST